MFIPVAEPVIGAEELRLVTQTIKSGWISSKGENIINFEKLFSKFCGAKYGIAVSNGTAALHLLLVAAEIGPGDEVIVPAMTFVATANAAVYTGAKPVFVDSETETWNIDPEKIKEKINRKTRAIIPVHLYGHPAAMNEILKIARKYNLLVFEDAAEAHGAKYRGRRVGTFGKASSFSFFGNKVITTGEGGFVATNDKEFAEKVRTLRDHGARGNRKYRNPVLGFNYRMTNIQAALGLAQLKRINKIIARKREIAALYAEYLNPLVPRITLHPEADWAKSIFWMYSILVYKNGKQDRNFLIDKLKKHGIETRPFFYPLHKIGRFKADARLPVAELLSKTGLNLPSSPLLKDEQIKFICDKILSILS